MHEPFELFHQWISEAKSHPAISEPTAMSVATADADGNPSCRILLLKEYDESGFVFYTNHRTGRKSLALQQNPKAALCFYWMPLSKQIRIEGRVEIIDGAQADAYFASRSRTSQLGAWASQQSERLASRSALKDAIAQYDSTFHGQPVPRPPHWMGWKLIPVRMEFWVEREFRLHERWDYTLQPNGEWHKSFLYP